METLRKEQKNTSKGLKTHDNTSLILNRRISYLN